MSTSNGATRAEVCIVACAEAWRGDAARLARATFEPDLLISDGEALLGLGTWPVGEPPPVIEGWIPFRFIFDLLYAGRRHVMMGASQIDPYGNTNISAIGDYRRPTAQLVGVRGAPGNTVNHPTSYWIRKHTPRSFVPTVDMVSGVGYDRAAAADTSAIRFHELRRVVSNLAVFDFATPDHRMRLVSVHPGVTVDEVVASTGFELVIPPDVPRTREPTPQELDLIRDVIDPRNLRFAEVPG